MGRAAIHYGAIAMRDEVIDYLAGEKEADIDKQSIGGLTPLMYAVKTGNQGIIAAILNNNGNPFFRDQFGREANDQISDVAEIATLLGSAKEQWIQ